MSLIILPLTAIVATLGVGISTLVAGFTGIATIMVTSMAAFLAFLLVLI